MENIFIALVVSVFAPIIVGLITSYNNRLDKRIQWDREDTVAAKAAEAAKLLLASNERVASTSKITNNKLDTIHALVNSNMTAAMQSEYDATRRELVLLLYVLELNRRAGSEPTQESLVEIDTAKKRIAELAIALESRRAVAPSV